METPGYGRFWWGCDGTGRVVKEGARLSPEMQPLGAARFVHIDVEPDPAYALPGCHPGPPQNRLRFILSLPSNVLTWTNDPGLGINIID